MKKILLAFIITLIGFAVQAQEKKNKNAKYDIEVKGNCEMCKKRIEKAAYAVSGVKSAVWTADNQSLHLLLNEEKANPLLVQESIAKAGHDTEKVKANTDDYGKLHSCCQYER
ncbi:heavy-metal-associated domain-containing protein [Flavobacterium sp. UBA4197]|uniref:heavy-metal-associated domain-containing protein n=1 Tax=Flavobacterium sp. UBA4197 TaxID=1946546 RepID=UPI00257E541D|nr:metal transporter [Flavobacterium sp. UBA4197]